MSVLALQNLSVHRGHNTLLENISLQLNAGELLVIAGPNGAGKSTLLQHLAGVMPIEQGKLSIQQRNVSTWQAKEWAQHVSFLPQLSRLSFPLTVREVVQLGSLATELTHQKLGELSEQALKRWQLMEFAERDVRRLSGGEQQRVQLARSWLQLQAEHCHIWLLDEPFSALDLCYQKQCLEQIQILKQQGKAIVLIVHDLNFARHCADRVLLLQRGRMVSVGSAAEVLTAERVSQTFLVDTYLEGNNLHWW